MSLNETLRGKNKTPAFAPTKDHIGLFTLCWKMTWFRLLLINLVRPIQNRIIPLSPDIPKEAKRKFLPEILQKEMYHDFSWFQLSCTQYTYYNISYFTICHQFPLQNHMKALSAARTKYQHVLNIRLILWTNIWLKADKFNVPNEFTPLWEEGS